MQLTVIHENKQLQSVFNPENVLGENQEQAKYTIVVVIIFTSFVAIFLVHGRCLIDKRMVLCLMHGTITKITRAQL